MTIPTDQAKKTAIFKLALAQAGIADTDADELINQWPDANPDNFVSEMDAIARILELDEPPNLIQPTEQPWQGIHAVMLTAQHMAAAFTDALAQYSDMLVMAISNAIHVRQAVASQKAKNQKTKKRLYQDELADEWRTANPDIVYGLGEFRRYEAGLWKAIPTDKIKVQVKKVLVKAKSRGAYPSASLVNSVTELARFDISVSDIDWDANSDLITCTNGTLHIPTLTLQPHAKQDYLTTGVPFAYDPSAPAPVWEAFLSGTLQIDVIECLQEFAGYALTTDTRYEIAIWLYGPPGSGKSTFLTGLQTMLGNRAGLLSLADIERSSFALADLPGKTLVVSMEQPSLFMRSSGKINSIISGEPIKVERKYENAVDIIPRAKIAWAMNELPRVGDAGDGIFRRVKVIRFERRDLNDQDPEVKEAIKTEGPGILNWALLGLQRLRARGKFMIPQSVTDATEEFKLTNDIPAMFIDEMCDIGPNSKIQSSHLYTAYANWCQANGHRAQSSTSLSKDWERLGFHRRRSGGSTFWDGLNLKV